MSSKFGTNTMIARAVLLLSLMLWFPALAADPDPLDAALNGDAIRAWDKRLNEVYQQVMAGLDPKSRGLLRASRRRWVAFREAEHEAIGGPWRQDRGTIICVLTVNADLSAIKQRVQELQLYGPAGG